MALGAVLWSIAKLIADWVMWSQRRQEHFGAFRNLSAALMLGKQSNQRLHLTLTWRQLYLDTLSASSCLPVCQGGLLSLCSPWEKEIKKATIYFETQGVIRLTASQESEWENRGRGRWRWKSNLIRAHPQVPLPFCLFTFDCFCLSAALSSSPPHSPRHTLILSLLTSAHH